jgi:hypothetical protein
MVAEVVATPRAAKNVATLVSPTYKKNAARSIEVP